MVSMVVERARGADAGQPAHQKPAIQHSSCQPASQPASQKAPAASQHQQPTHAGNVPRSPSGRSSMDLPQNLLFTSASPSYRHRRPSATAAMMVGWCTTFSARNLQWQEHEEAALGVSNAQWGGASPSQPETCSGSKGGQAAEAAAAAVSNGGGVGWRHSEPDTRSGSAAGGGSRKKGQGGTGRAVGRLAG